MAQKSETVVQITFSLQDLPNLSQDTDMKHIKNVKLSFKSGFSHQELSNSSRNCRPNHVLVLKHFQTDLEKLA